MKKYAVLLLLVLGLSSTALGISRVDVWVSQPGTLPPVCGDDVAVRAKVCVPQDAGFVKWQQSQSGSIIYLDMYLKCTSPCGPAEISRGKWILSDAKCGLYTVVVRVWMDYSACGWPYCMFGQPTLIGMSSTYFTVCCDECGHFPCRCAFQWPSWPCYPCPTYSCPQ